MKPAASHLRRPFAAPVFRAHTRSLLLPLTALALVAADPAPTPHPVLAAVRDGDRAAWSSLLTAGSKDKPNPAVAARDAAGNTPLHLAALQHHLDAVRAFLDAGAEVDARNTAEATPLLYGAGHADIARLLLARGANPNAVSKALNTPLMVAAAYPESFDAVQVLLDAGANVHARKNTELEVVLPRAVNAGDVRTVDLLLARGAGKDPETLSAALMAASFNGHQPLVTKLLALGANPNADPQFAGHALNTALLANQTDVAELLLAHGADPHLRSPRGPATPPLVFAAYNQSGDPRIARALLERGAKLGDLDANGASALTYALRSGSGTPLVAYLQEAGLKPTDTPRAKHTPDRPVPEAPAARAALLRERLPAALSLLQRSSDAFLDNAFVRRANCTSCHGQDLPALAYRLARSRGLTVDDGSQGHQLSRQLSRWSDRGELARQMTSPLPGDPATIAYGLVGLQASGHAPDDMTDAMTRYLLRVQQPNGSWNDPISRPPMEDGTLVGTGLTALALRQYSPRGLTAEVDAAHARAARWLVAQKPTRHNEAVYRLFGLHASRAPRPAIDQASRELLATQRPDGGWSQLPALESDAWATGSALYALHQSAGLPVADPAYQRGLAFLLRTQFEDGSWWVRTRTWPFQPHFDSKFPHGKDQWISQGGTAWAAIALLLALEPAASPPPAPTVAQLIAAFDARTKSASPTAAGGIAVASTSAPAEVDFAKDIRPLFERSCAGCHSGEKPRAGFVVETRAALIKGGASGEPAIIPGRADASALFHYTSGKIEDLEMPPLDRREKYPALSTAELDLIRRWIDAGAPESASGN